jgi:type II secretory pathway component GspD/PulD (secretin)
MNRLVFALAFALAVPTLAQDKKPDAKPDPNAEVKTRLESKKLSFTFEDTPLRDAFWFVNDIAEVTVVIDPAAAKAVADAKVTLKSKDITAQNALDLLVDAPKLAHRVWHGVVLITKKDEKVDEPEIQPTDGLKKMLDAKKSWFRFDDAPIADVAKKLSDLTGEKFQVDKKLDLKVTVALRDDTPLGDALAVLCRLGNLKLVAENGENVFKSAKS